MYTKYINVFDFAFFRYYNSKQEANLNAQFEEVPMLFRYKTII